MWNCAAASTARGVSSVDALSMTMQSTATSEGIVSAATLLRVSRNSRARLWVGIAMVTDFLNRASCLLAMLKTESRRW